MTYVRPLNANVPVPMTGMGVGGKVGTTRREPSWGGWGGGCCYGEEGGQ